MKYIFAIFLVCLYSLCGFSQNIDEIKDVPLAHDLKSTTFIHVISSLSINHVNSGDLIGKVAPYPDTLSKQFSEEINASIRYYKNQKYAEAKSVLEVPIVKEPNNHFILSSYARASYQVDKDKSFETYKFLVSKLDSIYHHSSDSLVIDLWFREAYWKLGTLYMDHKMWKEAYYEISRFIISAQDVKGSLVYSQALQFLTECAYMLYDDKLAIYLANRTLYYDPVNEYAKGIINKLK
jgi:hypothetical protein